MSDRATKRGELLDRYGFDKRWIRFTRPIRIVDARPRRNGDHYLAWEHVEDPFAPPAPRGIRWISEKNFTRFYREVTEPEPGRKVWVGRELGDATIKNRSE